MIKFEEVDYKFKKHAFAIKLPTRATNNSAGYDFYSPETVTIEPQTMRIISTDVKAQMSDFLFLQLVPRSSIGIKKHLMLANSTGIIDSDFYNNESNNGSINIAFFNYGNESVTIEKDERIAQGIFCRYGITEDDYPLSVIRVGGIGSTN